jgi:predicted transcriptional regulator
MITQREILNAISVHIDNDAEKIRRISESVFLAILPDQQRIIVKNLSNHPLPVSEISKRTGVESKNISSQLNQISKRCLFLKFKKDKKNKLWYIKP